MEVATIESTAPSPQVITAEFLLRALRDNKDEIARSFNASISALSQRVNAKAERVSDNAACIARNKEDVSVHNTEQQRLTSRVETLERSMRKGNNALTRRARLSEEYLSARRSACLWHIKADNDRDL